MKEYRNLKKATTNRIYIHVSDGRQGAWEIRTFEVTEMEAWRTNMSASMKGREIEPGTYKALIRWDMSNIHLRHGQTIMSNTPAEVRDHMPFIEKAKGDVLIFGLGLGMVVQALIDKPDVKTITVVEKSKSVIKLSGDYYCNVSDKVKIINKDALKYYSAEARYDAIWFDIWDDICSANLPEMYMLMERWKKNAKVRMCWAKKECIGMLKKSYEVDKLIGKLSDEKVIKRIMKHLA